MASTVPYPFELVLAHLDPKYRQMAHEATHACRIKHGVSTKAYRELVQSFNHIQQLNAERRFWQELER